MQTESFLGEKDARREGTAVGVEGQKGLIWGPQVSGSQPASVITDKIILAGTL